MNVIDINEGAVLNKVLDKNFGKVISLTVFLDYDAFNRNPVRWAG